MLGGGSLWFSYMESVDLVSQENEIICLRQLKKFLSVQESAYKQKSRIQWLKLGDSNSKVFFSAMKERYSTNSIDVLYDSQGTKLTTETEITEEIGKFYKQLVGTAATTLTVTEKEIDEAIKGINIHKAPGLDGYNSLFFHKTWVIVRHDIYDAVRELFVTGVLLKQVNTTAILTTRMQSVIGKVVHCAQAGFIPGRNISDNILLASELIKCYTRKNISPRCMIKVDLRKAYDSLEWPFLTSMLAELGFPNVFIQWIMQCLETVSYSILVNGYPSKPIPEKKRP
ncbi:uncharacterized protein [Spinacia oleracea]|uniref:Reverse transcriptase domain-containing protein n=1 Tax=Spinacia oleracea TaxID=3562 RepID=A0A9R0IHN7_SPIOL|nr:uncharacterized protein LOC110788956 [Spinacia oleracea]